MLFFKCFHYLSINNVFFLEKNIFIHKYTHINNNNTTLFFYSLGIKIISFKNLSFLVFLVVELKVFFIQ